MGALSGSGPLSRSVGLQPSGLDHSLSPGGQLAGGFYRVLVSVLVSTSVDSWRCRLCLAGLADAAAARTGESSSLETATTGACSRASFGFRVSRQLRFVDDLLPGALR